MPADEPRMPDEAVVALLDALRTRRAPPVHLAPPRNAPGEVGDWRAPLVLLLVVAGALLGSLFRTPDSGSATAAACGASALAAPMPPGDPPHATSSPTPSAVGRAHVHRRPAAVAGSHAAVAPRAARAPAGDRPDVAPPPR
ncbi:MAG: hypothetical protein H6806_02750 [Planctomycetes bacterium]|nr:hypothetical protein [Planctomycetota bacterium]MCB9828672.1 hypothetical protein [Planctomycetota bacterium]MCB9901036.1 hypothetical protein [Planctomycetota bacterium]